MLLTSRGAIVCTTEERSQPSSDVFYCRGALEIEVVIGDGESDDRLAGKKREFDRCGGNA